MFIILSLIYLCGTVHIKQVSGLVHSAFAFCTISNLFVSTADMPAITKKAHWVALSYLSVGTTRTLVIFRKF